MIFSNSTSEIYYLLSKKIKCYDIFILNKIINEKKRLEDNENIDWHINMGIQLKMLCGELPTSLFLINKDINDSFHYISSDKLESRPHYIHDIHVSSYDGFILNYENGIYSTPSLKEKCETLNYYTKHYGIYEITKKKFNYECFILTDLVGNKCIRSIIRKKIDDIIVYEYKTIAIMSDGYNDPVERYPSTMNSQV